MGCETNSTQKIQGDDKLTKIITTYAQNFENYELTNNTIELENNQTISGITLTTSGVKEVPNLSTFFDGWEVNELGDTISASLISYETWNIYCEYYEALEQSVPYELMVGEVEDLDNARKEFHDTVTYQIQLQCGKIPEGTFRPNQTFFDIIFDEGTEEENRYASFRGRFFDRFGRWDAKSYYSNFFEKSGENYYFSGYNISGSIEKIENAINDKCPYIAYFDLSETNVNEKGELISWPINHYQGCAYPVKYDFALFEEGTLKHLTQKINRPFSWTQNLETSYYRVDQLIKKYAFISLYYDDKVEQLILETKDEKWTPLFQGDTYEISDELCEKFLQYDYDLMGMAFSQCPKG